MMKLTLAVKVFLYFLIVTSISLVSLGTATYWQSSRAIDKQMENQFSQIVGNALNNTELYLRAYDRALLSFMSSDAIGGFLAMDKDNYQYFSLASQIKQYVMEPLAIRHPEVRMIYLLGADRAIYHISALSEALYVSEEVDRQISMLRNRISQGRLTVFKSSTVQGPREFMFTLARNMHVPRLSNLSAIIAIEVSANELADIWKGIDLGENGYFFILDDVGQTVYHSHVHLQDEAYAQALETMSVSGSRLTADDKAFFVRDRMFVRQTSSYSGWTVALSVPVNELREPIANIRATTIWVGVASLLLGLLAAYRFGLSIIKPVRQLKEGMREIERGKWAKIPEHGARDEFGDLTSRYNQMVSRLSELVDEVYLAELRNQKNIAQKRQAEIQALQLQINPHFLYNTLETIVCYAAVQDSDEISEIVKAMAYMLRYSVRTSIEEITVANELKHVLNYLIILKHRIGREPVCDVVIHPDYLLEKMVRLTLQPLVENIFQHAFPEGMKEHHYIRIDASKNDRYFIVIVEDNGCGIAESRLLDIRSMLAQAAGISEEDEKRLHTGIGLCNVHRRIQLLYGPEYGLRVESKPGEGTRMYLSMPSDANRRTS